MSRHPIQQEDASAARTSLLSGPASVGSRRRSQPKRTARESSLSRRDPSLEAHLPSPVDTCGPSRITKTTCDWYQTATEISVGFSLMTSTPVSTGCWLTERVLALSFMVSAPTLWAWVD